MPLPTFTKLGPSPSFDDLVKKVNVLSGELSNLMLNLDSLNVVSLTADHIDAGTIDANVVTIRSDLTAGAYVQIDGNGMVINNGSFNTFTADINGAVTMTSALIQSSSSYPRIVMDPTNDLFVAYETATDYIALEPIGSFNSAPGLNIVQGANNVVMGFGAGSTSTVGLYSSVEFEMRMPNGLLMPGNTMWTDFTNLKNLTSGLNLQQTLNAKATAGAATSTDGSHNHGIPNGTVLMVDGGGTVTFVTSGSHSHTQT